LRLFLPGFLVTPKILIRKEDKPHFFKIVLIKKIPHNGKSYTADSLDGISSGFQRECLPPIPPEP